MHSTKWLHTFVIPSLKLSGSVFSQMTIFIGHLKFYSCRPTFHRRMSLSQNVCKLIFGSGLIHQHFWWSIFLIGCLEATAVERGHSSHKGEQETNFQVGGPQMQQKACLLFRILDVGMIKGSVALQNKVKILVKFSAQGNCARLEIRT